MLAMKSIRQGEILKENNLQPLVLGPKEGLALINGTQFILAFAIKAVERLNNALNVADLIGAMSLEGLMGSSRPFDARLHAIRPFKGTKHVAKRLAALLEGSAIGSTCWIATGYRTHIPCVVCRRCMAHRVMPGCI
jgi:histidine ammonia-lyase